MPSLAFLVSDQSIRKPVIMLWSRFVPNWTGGAREETVIVATSAASHGRARATILWIAVGELFL